MASTGVALLGLSVIPAVVDSGPALAATTTHHTTTTTTVHGLKKKPKAAGLPAGVVADTKVPMAVANSVTLRKQVQLASCSRVTGGWRASGSAKGVHGHTSYTVTVFFTTAANTVIATGSTKVPVDRANPSSWKVVGHFLAPAGTRCIFRGVG